MKRKRRQTKQAELIWDAIQNETSHPTADQVYDTVRKALPNISLGTVYRNLQKLVADGKLQVLILGRSQHFDPLLIQHQHFICEHCNHVYDILLDPGAEQAPRTPTPDGFTVTSHRVALYGSCAHCAP